MNRKLDNLGRVTIPVEMREQLGLASGENVKLEIKGKKIIITNPKDDFDIEQHIKEVILPSLVGQNELTIGAREMCYRLLEKLEGKNE